MYTPVNLSFTVKVGFKGVKKQHRRVFVKNMSQKVFGKQCRPRSDDTEHDIDQGLYRLHYIQEFL